MKREERRLVGRAGARRRDKIFADASTANDCHAASNDLPLLPLHSRRDKQAPLHPPPPIVGNMVFVAGPTCLFSRWWGVEHEGYCFAVCRYLYARTVELFAVIKFFAPGAPAVRGRERRSLRVHPAERWRKRARQCSEGGREG